MIPIRQFFENLKFKNQFPTQKEFKNELQNLFFNDNHSIESYNLFYKGIESFFNFSSKFIHDKNNTDGEINKVPIARKEDVYLGYSISISLLNIIGRKLNAPVDSQ